MDKDVQLLMPIRNSNNNMALLHSYQKVKGEK